MRVIYNQTTRINLMQPIWLEYQWSYNSWDQHSRSVAARHRTSNFNAMESGCEINQNDLHGQKWCVVLSKLHQNAFVALNRTISLRLQPRLNSVSTTLDMWEKVTFWVFSPLNESRQLNVITTRQQRSLRYYWAGWRWWHDGMLDLPTRRNLVLILWQW